VQTTADGEDSEGGEKHWDNQRYLMDDELWNGGCGVFDVIFLYDYFTQQELLSPSFISSML